MIPELEDFESVDLRDIWPDEAKDFTPWLAQSENLALLAEALNMELIFKAQEKIVGQFRADIVCRNSEDDTWVLIENQLEDTDHIHLGQILTYAAGLDAATIIWVAAGFTDDHRATLDWLNKITAERFRFFGVVIELWRCRDSLPMPNFTVISAPNDWDGPIIPPGPHFVKVSTPRQQRERFWKDFRTYLIDRDSPLCPRKMPSRSYLVFGIGHSAFKLSAMLSVEKKHIGVRLYLSGPNAAEHFRMLAAKREVIEREFGEPLEWLESFGRDPCRVTLRKDNTDPTDETDWSNQFEWLRLNLEKLDEIFRARVTNF